MINIEDYVERQMTRRQEKVKYARTVPIKIRKIVNSSTGDIINDSIVFNAFNEYWFLINAKNLPIGTRITSDTNIVLIENDTTDNLEEFSGKIEIQLPSAYTGSIAQALFYQVIVD